MLLSGGFFFSNVCTVHRAIVYISFLKVGFTYSIINRGTTTATERDYKRDNLQIVNKRTINDQFFVMFLLNLLDACALL